MTHTALSHCWSRTESERFYSNPKQAAKLWRLVLTPRHVWLVGVHRNTQSKKQNRTELGKRKCQVHCFSSLAWKNRVSKSCALTWPVLVSNQPPNDLWFQIPHIKSVILHPLHAQGRHSLLPSVHGIMWKCFCACTFVTSPQHFGSQIHWLHVENQWSGIKLWLTV